MIEPMDCTTTQNMFSALADGELTGADVHRMEDHLATCHNCAREWRLFKESLALLHAIEPAAAPGDLLIGIHAKLDQTNPVIDWLRDLFGSPLRSLSSLTAIAIAIFFWAAPQNNNNQTAPNILANNGAVTKSRSSAPQLKTISVMNNNSRTWANSASAPPYQLLAPPTLTPDIAITVHTASQEAQEHLYQRLASLNRWRIHHVRGGLLIYLDKQDLHLLQHTLAPHRLTLAAHPPLTPNGDKRLQAVNLRIESQ